MAHWQACGWYLVHAVQKSNWSLGGSGGVGGGDDVLSTNEETTTWVDVLAESQGTYPETLDNDTRFAQYVACAYWATTTMTTIGYGDIVPVTTVERFLVISAQLVGKCFPITTHRLPDCPYSYQKGLLPLP